jgi:transcriptional regulator with XRE-family HTH domain
MARSITDTLREAIERSGLSTKALADRSGVSRPSVIKFRRGECSLRLDMVDKLAAVLNLELVQAKVKR